MSRLAVLLCLVWVPSAEARSYSTAFSTAENPISEGGLWVNGRTEGVDWANVQVSPAGVAHGTQSGSDGYDDSTALLRGSWGPDQTVSAVVHSVNQQSGNNFEEVEVRLRSSIAAHSNTGYECNYRALASGNVYVQIVRWNGPLGDFTYLDSRAGPGIHDGDTVGCAISGTTITTKVNGSTVFSVTDNTYSSGAPGIGFFSQFDGSDAPLDADFGFTGLVVMDEPCSALGNMGNTLLLVKRGPPAQAVAHWSSLPGAVTYNLYEDTVKDGSFGTRTVSGRDGTAGQPFPWPAGDCLYYRIAAADACGEGPK